MTTDNQHHDLAGRVRRLEEHLAFAEHTVEALSAEVQSLNARLRDLSQRLARAESTLGKALAPPQSPPPESPDDQTAA